LLVLPLIENCFKHGTSQILDQPWINLQIIIKENELRMKLLNGKSDQAPVSKSASGIGIHNVEKRLELLYPGKYDLTITNDEDVFIVNLRIQLEKITEPLIKTNLTPITHA
jgi:LytS/YehU family sensor histidine kinase